MPRSAAPPRRAREPAAGGRADRRAQLVDATLTAIARHGLSRTTLARVAEIAALSPGIVSFYFSSKDALLLATLRFLAEEFDDSVEAAMARAGRRPVDGLLALIDASFDPSLSDPRKVAVWYAFWGESQARQEYLAVCGEKEDAYYRTIVDLCAQLIEEGGYAHLDAEAVARGFIGILDGLWQEILGQPGEFDRGLARDKCRAYLASVFPGALETPRRPGAAAATPAPSPPGAPRTLPAWVYHHDEFHALERERIFLPGWQVVCHASELPCAGSYVAFEMLGERAFVVRGRDGELRAFHNVCRHRAHAVVQGRSGRCERFLQCPYHGWTYDFDGALRAVPSERTFPALAKEELGLPPVEIEVFQGFVFLRFAGGGAGVAERLAPFAGELEHYRFAEMRPLDGADWEDELEVDWKNVMDNYLEDYHFPTAHRGLAGLMRPEYERDARPALGVSRLSHVLREEPAGRWSEQRYRNLLPEQPHLPPELRRRWSYFSLFPSVNLDVYPDQMDFFQILPLGPGRSYLRARRYGLPDARPEMRAARWLNQRINQRVQAEDAGLTRSVQGGLAGGSYASGRLSEKEVALHGLQQWIRAALPVASLAQPPAAGHVAALNRELAARGPGRGPQS